MKSNEEMIADIAMWLGGDAYQYLTIKELFSHAEKASIIAGHEAGAQISETLQKFHSICEQIVQKH